VSDDDAGEGLPRSLKELSRAFREKRLSPVEVVRALLERIEAADKDLGAFITVLPESALEAAARAEEEMTAGRYRGPLHGVPLGLKDLIYTEGVRTTMGSAFFKDYVPDYSATVALKLEQAGAVLVGKTNTHEFAYGPTGDRSYFGPTRNPHDTRRISGGSSGGSGAALRLFRLRHRRLGSNSFRPVRRRRREAYLRAG
jgi:aspartyl-tRNA(Asn)/glutamyl-tRNA(Gln) amidotransferase subunit A